MVNSSLTNPDGLPGEYKQKYNVYLYELSSLYDGLIKKEHLMLLAHYSVISEFIYKQLVTSPHRFIALYDSGLLDEEQNLEDYSQRGQHLYQVEDEDKLMKGLREFRNQEMLRIAWRELSGRVDVRQSMLELSLLAKQLILICLDCLTRMLSKRFGFALGANARALNLYVLAVGKLGGGELNFSSDIDLIFIYPQDGMTSKGPHSIPFFQYFTKLAQKMVKVLSTNNAHGFVFRTDMRLRPNGEAGPLVITLDGFEAYYQEQGRTWERYALVKAQCLNTPDMYTQRIQSIISPFVYRRYMDFSVIDSLRSIKQLIKQEVKMLKTLDVKRGAGGIREIEFVVQAFQLIHGGKNHHLRSQSLLATINQLTMEKLLPEGDLSSLTKAYLFYRRLENILQIRQDRQTHSIPTDTMEKELIACAMHYPNWEALQGEMNKHTQSVGDIFSAMLRTNRLPQGAQNQNYFESLQTLWVGQLSSKLAVNCLKNIGYDEPEKAYQLIQSLRASRRCKSLSQFATSRLNQVLPLLLEELALQPQSMRTLERVLAFIEAIAMRSAYLALLWENKYAREQCIELFSQSSWIANKLTQQPFLLEMLLTEAHLKKPVEKAVLSADLTSRLKRIGVDDEQELEELRRFKLSQELKAAAAEVKKHLPLMKVSDHLTYTAETVLNETLNIAYRQLLKKQQGFHDLQDKFAIIAYGKLGGYELSYGSDLDLVFLHALEKENELAAIRLSQRILHLLNTRSNVGVLYAVDTRLRPSGSAGLLVSHVDAFCDYQLQSAWTWEHQALIRARFITGSASIEEKFNRLRRNVLTQPRAVKQLQKDICQMRNKMRTIDHEHRRFDIKFGHGGIIDLEFLVQYSVLAWASIFPQLATYTDNIRCIEALVGVGKLTPSEADSLIDCYLAYRHYCHNQTLEPCQNNMTLKGLPTEVKLVRSYWKKWLMCEEEET